MPEPVGPGGLLAPQYFEDQLTLFEHGRADYPHLLLLPPPPKKKNVFHLPAALKLKTRSDWFVKIRNSGFAILETIA